jgi:hypothetical protein
MKYTIEQFKNQSANWSDEHYNYAVHITGGGAVYLHQIDGNITNANLQTIQTIRIDGVQLDKIFENLKKVIKQNDEKYKVQGV